MSATAVAVLVAVPAAALAAVAAFRRFEWFLLGLIAVRPCLDLFHLGGGALDPASAVGGIFVLAAAGWLYVQWRTGCWVPVSGGTWSLYAFVALAGASILTSQSVLTSTVETTKVLAGVLMFAVLEQLLASNPNRARRVVLAVLASAVVPVLYSIQQIVAGDNSSYCSSPSCGLDVSRVTGTFTHPNPFATYLALLSLLVVALVPLVSGRQRVALIAYGGLLGTVLLFTYARGAWLAVLVGLGYLVSRRRRALAPALIGCLILLAVAIPSVRGRFADLTAAPPAVGVPSNSLAWRVGYWRAVVPLADRNPVDGIGLGVVEKTLGLPPHNVYVQAYTETGVAGLAGLLGVLVGIGSTLRRRIRTARTPAEVSLACAAVAMALGLLVQSVTENLLDQTMAYWYFAAACCWGLTARVGSVVGRSPVAVDHQPAAVDRAPT